MEFFYKEGNFKAQDFQNDTVNIHDIIWEYSQSDP